MRGIHRPTQAEIDARVAAGRRWMLHRTDDLDMEPGVPVAQPNELEDEDAELVESGVLSHLVEAALAEMSPSANWRAELDAIGEDDLVEMQNLYAYLPSDKRREFMRWCRCHELVTAEEEYPKVHQATGALREQSGNQSLSGSSY